MSTSAKDDIPKKLRDAVGPPDEGTRIYRREGSDQEVGGWYDALCEEYPEGLVSPGGVAMYAPVSRAGVHKKLKEGKLTAFCFHITRNERSLFGYQKKLKERPYIYIPVSECKRWAEELKASPARSAEKDWNDDFLARDPKDKKSRRVKYVD